MTIIFYLWLIITVIFGFIGQGTVAYYAYTRMYPSNADNRDFQIALLRENEAKLEDKIVRLEREREALITTIVKRLVTQE